MPADLMASHEEADEFFIEQNIPFSQFSEAEKRNLVKNKSMGTEKRISVDPFSLRESANSQLIIFPPLHPPTKPKFLSYSLPNSASSSPKFSSMLSRKKSRNLNHENSIALRNLERLRESHLRRSKSCGEGRTSALPEEFELNWMAKSKSVKLNHRNSNNKEYLYNKSEAKLEQKKSYSPEMTADFLDEKFKCGALCLFLPGFGKGAKPIRARREEQAETLHFQEPENLALVVSKRVSLEKFECGSRRSSAISEDPDSSNLFYDLPLEMIRCSDSDTNTPVTTAFVFDHKDRKGVLKKSSSRSTPKKSPDSSRHVRFSTSSPASYPASPNSYCFAAHDGRLHKAREDLSLFLEAQTV